MEQQISRGSAPTRIFSYPYTFYVELFLASFAESFVLSLMYIY